jgi:hypothetical protein
MPRNTNEGLNMASSTPFLPHTFPDPGYAGFKVTINADRSIKVRQGDWLSKYSMAIYGDFDHVDKFRKKDGSVYVKVTDKDLIKTGEILYHPDALPGESSGEGTGGSEPPLQARYVAEFFDWIRNMFVPTEWTVFGSGLVPSEYGLVGMIGMKDIDPWLPGALQPTTRWYRISSNGLFYDEDKLLGEPISTVRFISDECVLKFRPWRSTRLTFDDFRGTIFVIEPGTNIVSFAHSRSLTAIIFGMESRHATERALDRCFRYGLRDALELMFMGRPGAGIALVYGPFNGRPDTGMTAHSGGMFDDAEVE